MKVILAAVLAVITIAVPAAANVPRAACSGACVALDKADQLVLAFAAARDAEFLLVNIVAEPGRFDGLARAIAAVPGARIAYTAPEADFLTVAAPLALIEQLVGTPGIAVVSLENPAVNFAELEVIHAFSRSTPTPLPDQVSPTPEAAADLPSFPFAASSQRTWIDLNAAILRQADPRIDGRGVTIGFVEAMPDIAAPEFAIAYTREGRAVRKVVDVVPTRQRAYSLRPGGDGDDIRWSPFDARDASTGTRRGHLRLPGYYTRLAGLELCATPSRLGVSPGSAAGLPDLAYAFEYDEGRRRVRVDVDCDARVDDEQWVGVFSETGELLQLGTRVRDGDYKRSLTIAVTVEPGFDGLIFQPGASDHVMVTAGAALANARPDGIVDGVAPGAGVIFYDHSPRLSAFVAALVNAYADARTDILLVESNEAVMRFRDISDSESVFAQVLRRLTGRTGKPTFLTVGNEFGIGQAYDACGVELVICVGTYRSQETTRLNEGLSLPHRDNVGRVGSSGPADNGAMAPDIVAPENPVSLALRFGDGPNLSRRPTGLYAPHYGSTIGGGSSTAGPVAAGAAALLLSAARREGITVEGRQLTRAILASARFMPEVPAYQQGRGLIDVEGALALLRHDAALPNGLAIEVAAPVATVSVHAPGRGLFEREGWSPRQRGRRLLTMIRRGGPAADLAVAVELVGAPPGVFRTPASLLLPLGRPVQVPVDIAVVGPGAYSALLRLVPAEAGMSVFETGLTIIVPALFGRDGAGIERQFELAPFARHSTYFRVPPRAGSLHVALNQPSTMVDGHLFSPSGHVLGRVMPRRTAGARALTIENPEAGVWEFVTINYDHGYVHRPSPGLARFDVRITLGQRRDEETHENTAGNALAGAADAPHAPRSRYQIRDLAIGEAVRRLSISAAADGADVDLYLFRCELGQRCAQVANARSLSALASLELSNPSAGSYRIVGISALPSAINLTSTIER